jgi:hypothetical protein
VQLREVELRQDVTVGEDDEEESGEDDEEGEESSQTEGEIKLLKAAILDSARWFASSLDIKSKMFVRNCYIALLKLVHHHWSIRSTRHVLLLGTPGTGKTFFLCYVAYMLLSVPRAFDVIIAFDGLAMWVSPSDESETLPLNNGKIPFGFQCLLEKPDTIVLYDCTGPSDCDPPGMAKCKVLVTSSPDHRKYSQYRKQQCQTLYMPLWSFEELELCRLNCFPEVQKADLDKKFRMWGGVIRYTVGAAAHSADTNLLAALGQMDFSAAELLVKRWQALDVQDVTVSHRLVHAETKDFYHISCKFASQYVCDQVFYNLAAEEEAKCKKFLATNTNYVFSAMKGQFHESYCHRYLANQTELQVRLLFDKGQEQDRFQNLSLGERKLKRFSVISELQESDYGVPDSKTFPAVDSLALPKFAFQMTISEDHPIATRGFLQQLEEMATNKQDLQYFVFVVPNNIAKEFKKQKYVNAAGNRYLRNLPSSLAALQQAVLGVDYK